MGKDYAKNNYSTKKPSSGLQKLAENALVLLAILFVMAMILGTYFHMHTNTVKMSFTNWLAHTKLLLTHKSPSFTPVLAKTVPPEVKSNNNDVHFDFYNELPNMHVTPSVTMANAATHPVNTLPLVKNSNDLHYVLQIGVYKNAVLASQTRLSLMLTGIQANVVKIVNGHTIVYRLQQGPYNKREQVIVAQQALLKKGITSFIKLA